MIRFVFTLLMLACIIAGLIFLGISQKWLEALPSFFYQTLLFLLFSTVVIYSYLYKVGKPDYFVQLYLLIMAVKLLAYGTYVYFMIAGDANGAVQNVVFFMASYFLFTVVETAFLYRENAGKHSR